MSDDELAWLLAEDVDGPDEESLDSVGAALDALIFETLRLIDSVLHLDYARSARGGRAVEHVLARTEALAVMQPDSSAREDSLARLGRMREVSRVVLAAAPRPSEGAVACARRGDRAVWDREVEVWRAGRQRDDAPPLIVLPRRRRRDTQPDTPTALREAATQIAALAIDPASDPTSDKAESR